MNNLPTTGEFDTIIKISMKITKGIEKSAQDDYIAAEHFADIQVYAQANPEPPD